MKFDSICFCFFSGWNLMRLYLTSHGMGYQKQVCIENRLNLQMVFFFCWEFDEIGLDKSRHGLSKQVERNLDWWVSSRKESHEQPKTKQNCDGRGGEHCLNLSMKPCNKNCFKTTLVTPNVNVQVLKRKKNWVRHGHLGGYDSGGDVLGRAQAM